MGTVLKTETRSLPCPLTDNELLAKGDALATKLREIDEEREHQEQAKSAMKERLAGLIADVGKLRQQIQERREFREVPVEIVLKDTRQGLVTEIRVDTGEVLRDRFMEDDERQMSLPAVRA